MPHNLTERIPEYLAERWRNTSVFWARLVIGGIAALWVPLCVGLAWLPFRHGSGSQQLIVVCIAGVTMFFAWCLLIYFLSRFTANAWSQSKLPFVEIAGDLITVRWHGETIESIVADCNLRRGRAWQMKYASINAGGLPIGDRDLILIDLPPLYRDILGNVRAYTTVAVGYTDDSMENWTAALGITGEPSDAHAPESASRAF